jgi:hypothetical protein
MVSLFGFPLLGIFGVHRSPAFASALDGSGSVREVAE